MMKKTALIAAALMMFFLPAGCACAAASPEPSEKTIKRELKIGRKGAEAIEKQVPRVLDPAAEARLAMIAAKLTPYLQRDLEYSVRILDMKEPNAFALPGGRTYFTTGMLEFLKSEDEIAAVMCHEFIHADRAHGIVQAKRNNRLTLLTIAGLVAATQAGGDSGAGIAAMANGLQTALMNSYSIELEKEADARGIDVLYKAGYNPAAMLTMMERMKVEKLKRAQYQMGIFQTHPEEEERVDAALKYLRDKGIEIQRKDVVQSLKIKTDTVSGDARLYVDDAVLLSVPATEASRKLFSELGERLDSTLELELAPYDIKILGEKGSQSLVIRRKTILTEEELLPGMPPLAELRDRINDALNRSRRGNMLTDYFD
ncbi:M48 family metalloprotease [Cloacibacillus evryensis]|uniref:M48 family metalloprotease n=1 Tax=Cloacibacillus evryensis TaxID=508460 RepID=UPI003AB563B5